VIPASYVLHPPVAALERGHAGRQDAKVGDRAWHERSLQAKRTQYEFLNGITERALDDVFDDQLHEHEPDV
jgi:hypothetical protein